MAGPEAVIPPVFIWVRTAIDWADEERSRAQLKPEFLPKLALWDATFSIPYHRFRHELCEIARLNLSRVAGAPVRAWDAIPDGSIVLPIDDDDWFAPDIVSRLAPLFDADAIGYRWLPAYLEVTVGPRHRLELFWREIFPWLAPRHLCATNGYAIVKRPGTREIGALHTHASRLFARESERVRVLGGHLSVVNRTLASQTTLFHKRPSISQRRLLGKYRRYRRLYGDAHLEGADWAAPYLERMASLMEELRLAKR